ncbi:MAG: transcriptional regulator BetI [Rhodobacteraceae bacterium]|nr:transcriptional regulator BetI [Paracoccaceae bacterium]
MTETQRPRKERKENADKRRRQILDATIRSIAANGLARTTLATVATEAGLSQGVAVFYFKSKNGLLTEALRDLYQAYTEHWQGALKRAGSDPVDRLLAIIRADFDSEIVNPEVLSVWFAFWGEQSVTTQYADIVREFDHKRQEALRSICMALLPADHERAIRIAVWVDAMTDGLWQHLHLYRKEQETGPALQTTLQFLSALLPEYADRLTACTAPNPD